MIKNRNFSLNTVVTHGKGNIVTDMDGETVIMSIQNSKYYNLGETGSNIWTLVKAPTPIQKVIDALCIEFNVDQSVCKEQVLTFFESLYIEGLIKVEEDDAR